MPTAPNVTIIPAKVQTAESRSKYHQLRVAAYCRVSTAQEEQQNSYQVQIAYYTDLINRKKEWTLAGIFADEGISGTQTKKRTEFNRMIRMCRNKKIDLVITKSISRFARNTVDCLEYVRQLKDLGICVIFVIDYIKTLTMTSEFMIALYGSFAQAESESISKNVSWGKEKAYRDKLQALITDLSAIDTSASYNAFDAMLILLREGVEALLIVMALVTILKAAKMRKGLKWVYGGAIAGVLASAVIAVILQVVFPAVTSGANREIIEGGVGIFAVAMMILIGIWLHSKSSVKQWNDFMDRQMKTVTATGSFVSMFASRFMAVFSEGAETNLLIGIGSAIAVLVIIAVAMTKASQYIKPHRIFFILTWLIYALAFKMLGVSIHALQLTNMMSNHLISGFPTIDWAGIYPSWEVLIPQLIFIVIIAFVTVKQHGKK